MTISKEHALSQDQTKMDTIQWKKKSETKSDPKETLKAPCKEVPSRLWYIRLSRATPVGVAVEKLKAGTISPPKR